MRLTDASGPLRCALSAANTMTYVTPSAANIDDLRHTDTLPGESPLRAGVANYDNTC